jgi:hypothetical protein
VGADPAGRLAATVVAPRAWVEIALVVVALLAGWGFMHQRDNRLRAEGRLELEIARADSTAEAAADRVRESEARDSAAAATVRQAEAARAVAERRAAELAARAPAAADSVVAASAPADSAKVRARLDQLVALYEARDRERLAQLAAADVVIGERDAVIVTKDGAIRSLQAALADAQAVTETALEAQPGWFERNGPKILVPLAFAVGWVAHTMTGG